MGEASVAYARANAKPQRNQHEGKKRLNAQERLALKKMRREAKAAGATLDNNGEGGLAPSLALGVFRKGRWRCSNTECPAPKKNITLDHISGHPEEIAADRGARHRKDLKRGIAMGHVNKLDAMHVLCAACHDSVHDRERAIDADKKPPPMPGEG